MGLSRLARRELAFINRRGILWWRYSDERFQRAIAGLMTTVPRLDAPGLPPRWTSSEKDAVSTAYSAAAKTWFTASHGTLNEIYYPTIDRPQTRDMELLFTDEETFFHEEKRDIGYDFQYIDENALAIRLTGHDVSGRYTVTKEIITDPHHAVVLMNVKVTATRTCCRG